MNDSVNCVCQLQVTSHADKKASLQPRSYHSHKLAAYTVQVQRGRASPHGIITTAGSVGVHPTWSKVLQCHVARSEAPGAVPKEWIVGWPVYKNRFVIATKAGN